jgi:hypothetical protein
VTSPPKLIFTRCNRISAICCRTRRRSNPALTQTARDLGSPGRDDLFGAGEADAYVAVRAATKTPAPAAVSAPPKETTERAMKTDENALEPKELPVIPALDPPVAAVASGKSDSGDRSGTAGQQPFRRRKPAYLALKKSPAVLNVPQPFGDQCVWER